MASEVARRLALVRSRIREEFPVPAAAKNNPEYQSLLAEEADLVEEEAAEVEVGLAARLFFQESCCADVESGHE